MFTNCISLTSIPELPATTLKSGCYMNMFNGCTSISSSTLLPATTLIALCYSNMFNGCSSLTSINVNLSAWNVTTGTTNWLSGVADTGVFICPESLPETYGTSNIPTGWTIMKK
jgi:surface protein